ncbi:imm11 family protein [Pigmentibacter ruber]|uniref:imm11 family protein n=1 Tax=Pigmentibacter ruber TaxID=2683196 RepID=UPI00131C30EA|nr:DUF1629 domain-containing protein [Pigmentibacter ruber]
MSEFYKIIDPSPKFKYLLFNQVVEKDSENRYEDDIFNEGKSVAITKDLYTTQLWGKKYTDFHYGVAFAIYINEKIISCLKAVGETNFQLIPIVVYPGERPYYILNILNIIDCVDRENSKFRLFTEEYGRPDLLGKFYTFDKMVLDRSKVPKDVHIFRLKGYDLPVFITKELAEEFKKQNIQGFTLKPME